MKYDTYIGRRDLDGRVKVFKVNIGGQRNLKGNLIELETPTTPDLTHERRFDWGHMGPGVNLLAKAILKDFLSDKEPSEKMIRSLVTNLLSVFPPTHFILIDHQIEEAIK